VTIVAVCALAILGVLSYLLTGGTIFASKSNLYLFIPDATGVEPGSPVRVNGIGIGKVTGVRLTKSTDPNRVIQVTMLVETDSLSYVSLDSSAEVSADTLIGDKFIDISSGKSPSHVPPNTEIRFQPPSDVLKSVDLAQFQRQIRQMEQTLSDIEAGRGPVGEFVEREQLYDDLVRSVQRIEGAISAAVESTGQIGSLLYSDVLYRQIADPVRQIDDALARLQSGQGTAGNLLRDSAQYDQLRQQAASFRSSLEEIRHGHGAAGQFIYSDRTWRDLVDGVSSISAGVDRIVTGPEFATTATYDNLNGRLAELRDLIQDVRRDPRKYLRIKVF
jgi:phospholipid/cholesterol/gamma-HCH transport system substrate-binding protein